MLHDHHDALATATPVEPAAPARAPLDPNCAHILVPVSLAARERPALALGLEMAAAKQARLALLHVVETVDPAGSLHWLDGIDRLHQATSLPNRIFALPEGRAALERRRCEVRDFLDRQAAPGLRSAVDVRAECRVGIVAEEVARFAQEEDVDLVILSSELTSGWLPMLPAHVRRILHLTRKRVVLVPPEGSLGAGSSSVRV